MTRAHCCCVGARAGGSRSAVGPMADAEAEAAAAAAALAQDTEVYLAPERLQLGEKISSGCFGDCFRGRYDGMEVAVKSLRLQSTGQMALMVQFKKELTGARVDNIPLGPSRLLTVRTPPRVPRAFRAALGVGAGRAHCARLAACAGPRGAAAALRPSPPPLARRPAGADALNPPSTPLPSSSQAAPPKHSPPGWRRRRAPELLSAV